MLQWRLRLLTLVVAFLHLDMTALAQQTGSIRGTVSDADFNVPLGSVRVQVVELSRSVETDLGGNYIVGQVEPGTYTLVFSRSGYIREVAVDVNVSAGDVIDVDVDLVGDFTEMEEFVVEDLLALGTASEIALLDLRFDSPSLLDSVGADVMSRAGASDAASALRLIPGTTVQDGKFAVIRGLPDRYVSSQLNGLRLPSADETTRAVELDQFPSPVIESVQVSKTFTPDQQGDASGGAVNVVLKSVPEGPIFQFRTQLSANSQVTGRKSFLSYDGGGLTTWGSDDGRRDPQLDNLGDNWEGAVGTSRIDAPIDWKTSLAVGGRQAIDTGVDLGGFLSLFYERDSSYYDDGVDDSLLVDTPGEGLTPETIGDSPAPGNDFQTRLFDIAEGTQLVQLGGVASMGVETDTQEFGVTYLYTRTAEDTATLAEDTRGKEFYYPDYDVNDPTHPGNTDGGVFTAPYLRLQTLSYVERTIGSLQFHGSHELPLWERLGGKDFAFLAPRFDWSFASSSAEFDQPDKRQFGSVWRARSFDPGFPDFGIPPSISDPTYTFFTPAANVNLGNLQRIFKNIKEDSEQMTGDLELPFDQRSGREGYFKFGGFRDKVDRDYDEETYSNFNDPNNSFVGDFDDFWSDAFPFEDEGHAITESTFDIDYRGEQEIAAAYAMLDLPLSERVNVIGGVRFESTDIDVSVFPEENAFYFPPGSTAQVDLPPTAPGEIGPADVRFSRDDVLPAISLTYEPTEVLTFRASYSETIARQTFRELTPLIQQEFLGGPIFIGNPELEMSELDNYDLRVDYKPTPSSLFSVSYFRKEVDQPIEFVQRLANLFSYTTAVNYTEGTLEGFEVEMRQELGAWWESLDGLSIGGNATFIDSVVKLPDDESAPFSGPDIQAPLFERDATNAPEHLYNIYATYDLEDSGTQFGLFYTVRGDTLTEGAAAVNGDFIPNVYQLEFDTLNFTFSQQLGDHWRFRFQAKNLTNPTIEEVYRSEFIDGDTRKTAFSRGIEFAIGFTLVI